MYWVDKHLIFTYYQKDKEFDEFLPKNVINFMSIAVAIHLLFGIFLFSNQNILNSQSQDAFKYGYNAQYLNNFWIAQNHIILYIIMSIVFVIIIIFQLVIINTFHNWFSLISIIIYTIFNQKIIVKYKQFLCKF